MRPAEWTMKGWLYVKSREITCNFCCSLLLEGRSWRRLLLPCTIFSVVLNHSVRGSAVASKSFIWIFKFWESMWCTHKFMNNSTTLNKIAMHKPQIKYTKHALLQPKITSAVQNKMILALLLTLQRYWKKSLR